MKNSNTFIGLMSGTSLDGVDIALCKITDEKCELINSYEYPFDVDLKAQILQMIAGVTINSDYSLQRLSIPF